MAFTHSFTQSHKIILSFHGSTAPSGSGPPQYRGFTITARHITFGRTPLDEWSFWRRNLYLTKHNSYERQTCMPRRDLNPQSQQADDLRPTPHTARPLTNAYFCTVVCRLWKKMINYILVQNWTSQIFKNLCFMFYIYYNLKTIGIPVQVLMVFFYIHRTVHHFIWIP